MHIGYVITEAGSVLVQVPADNRWGFCLCDDDQSWPGGFGVASNWEAVADDDPRITTADRERLQWLLDNSYHEENLAMNYPTTFLNQNAEKTIRRDGLKALKTTYEDLKHYRYKLAEYCKEYDALLYEFNQYPLEIEDERLTKGYLRYLICTGGPSIEVRFHGSKGRIEFVYLDWFSGVGFDVTDNVVFVWLREQVFELFPVEV